MSRRYALYYAPSPGSDLEAFGRRWLGRDHITGEPVERPKLDGLNSAEQAAITNQLGITASMPRSRHPSSSRQVNTRTISMQKPKILHQRVKHSKRRRCRLPSYRNGSPSRFPPLLVP